MWRVFLFYCFLSAPGPKTRRTYGPQATPHAFVFDQERRLRYEGRLDNSYRIELVKTQEARNAIDAILEHHEVAVKHTGVFRLLDEVAGESVFPDRGLAEDRGAARATGDGDCRRLEDAAR